MYIEEEQTRQWLIEKLPNYKQRSTKHTDKTKDRVTPTPLKAGGELRCSLISALFHFISIGLYFVQSDFKICFQINTYEGDTC